LYCGDPHGQFEHIVRAAQDLSASAVVLLGDMEPARPLHLELEPIVERVWWIPGNHDADSDACWTRVWGSQLEHRNVHGRVVILPDGTRLAGLGGVFRGIVWYPRSAAERSGVPALRSREEHARVTPRKDRWGGGHHRKHWGTIYPEELDRLAELEADVLVVHEAPGYHPNGFARPGYVGAGHGREGRCPRPSARCVGQFSELACASYGVGLRGITAIDVAAGATVVVPGELIRVEPMGGSLVHKVLYLDFDGVLHPERVFWHPRRGAHLAKDLVNAGHKLFEHAQLLERLLEEYPDVRIVLSTRWVMRYGHADTARRLPPGLRARCIGATYHSAMDDQTFDDLTRGVQVMADVGRRRPATWLALDDSTKGWPLLSGDNVIFTDPMLGIAAPNVLAKLELRLMRFGS
jgi:hypothetical protein